ncbi:ATPase [[Mycobacterium] wendilense]|uniref:ATPase n=1 Tax=[Mycobacterium] wendilense TaxID=3064284 RepID=A0ABM9M9E2_9MYCO|nr:ATPase [Mycolicibacterium sp. MU0050]CAJ1579650.1 ATPase [Mycolicibacterium sp. MU0050]
MLRVILAGVLVGVAAVAVPPAAAAPQTCPPVCDEIPDTAWPEPWSIPMNGRYHWPRLAPLARPVTDSTFKFEELCRSPRSPDDPRDYAVAAKAVVAHPAGQWQLQAQVLHWRGETWHGGELANQVFSAAVAALQGCQAGAPEFSPSITTAAIDRVAAVISGPQVVRQYLVVNPANSSIAELVLWNTPGADGAPPVRWPLVPDARVLEAIDAPLCAAYLGSCG